MSRAVWNEFTGLERNPPRPKQLDQEQYEPDWSLLYWLGGIAALTVTALIPLQGLVYILWPPPTAVVDYFSVFQSTPVLGFVDLDLLLVLDQLLIVVMLLAVFIGLWRSNPPPD